MGREPALRDNGGHYEEVSGPESSEDVRGIPAPLYLQKISTPAWWSTIVHSGGAQRRLRAGALARAAFSSHEHASSRTSRGDRDRPALAEHFCQASHPTSFQTSVHVCRAPSLHVPRYSTRSSFFSLRVERLREGAAAAGRAHRSRRRIANKVCRQVDALVVDKVAHEAAAGGGRRGAPAARRRDARDGHARGQPAVKLASPARAVGAVSAVGAAGKHLQLGHEEEEAHPDPCGACAPVPQSLAPRVGTGGFLVPIRR